MDHGIVPEPPIVFIGGSGRSGTNITKEILALHPEVATLPFEYRFIIDPNGIIDFYTRAQQHWSPYAVDSSIKQLEHFLWQLAQKPENDTAEAEWYRDWELEQWIPGYSEFITQLIDELTEFSYTATWPGIPTTHPWETMYFASPNHRRLQRSLSHFIYRCINAILEKQRKSVFVEDNTWNILYAKELLELCPGGKLIHLVRDPRDVVASLRKQRWTPDNLPDVINWYTQVMQRWNTVRAIIPDSSYVEIRMEDVVGETEKTVRNICNFIELSFHKNLLTLPLDKSHTGRWRDEFQQNERKLIEQELSELIEQYHYM